MGMGDLQQTLWKKEREREREGERIVKVQVLDFWLLAFGRSFCGFVFGEEKKSF